jgi:hypothetical protein
MQSSYVSQQYKQNPLKFLVKLMDLGRFTAELERLDSAMYILTGIVTYRCLHHHEQQRINGAILALRSYDGPLFGHLFGMVGQMSANPYWYCWSLSNEELRNFFVVNDNAKSALSYIGVDLSGLISASTIAGALLGIYKSGIKDGLKNVAAQSTNYSVTKDVANAGKLQGNIPKGAAIAAACITVFASVLFAMSSTNVKSAKQELMLRGLLTMDEF